MSYSRFSWPIAGTAVAVVALGLFMASVTLAAKPTDDTGAFLGNGAPSGPHFNLIFNAKQDHFTCPPAQFEVVSDGMEMATWAPSWSRVIRQTFASRCSET
jgi:hypothetical protein